MTEKATFEIFDARTICAQPGKYLGWPTAAVAPDGAVYAVFSGDRDAHVCPFGKIFLMRSLDQGQTWTVPRIVADTPLDDRDAGVCVCPDGTVVVSWFTSHFADYAWQYKVEYTRCYPSAENRWPAWETSLARISPADISQWAPSYASPDQGDFLKRWLGFWTMRSKDGGATWDAPTLSPVYAPHGPTVLANGDLFYVGMRHLARPQGEESIGAALSRDQGRTWELLATINGFPPYHGSAPNGFARLAEPHVVETQSGKLIGMARYEETKDPLRPFQSHLWQFESQDGGRTWSPPRKTEIVGKPPFLSVTGNGDILVSYAYRHEPHGERACFSHDDGKTWDYGEEVVIDDAPWRDHGYVSTVELSRENFLSVSYRKSGQHDKTVLRATRWRRVEGR